MGQAAEEGPRQVVLNVAGGGRDDVEVVEQPFGGGRQGLALLFAGERGVHLSQGAHVGGEPTQVGAPVAAARRNREQRRQPPGVLFQQLDAEELDTAAETALLWK